MKRAILILVSSFVIGRLEARSRYHFKVMLWRAKLLYLYTGMNKRTDCKCNNHHSSKATLAEMEELDKAMAQQ